MPVVRARDSDRRSWIASDVTIAVRPSRPDDRPFLQDLANRTVADSLSGLRTARPATLARSLENLFEEAFARDFAAFVAECDGVRAGFIVLVYDLRDEVTLGPQAFVVFTAVEPAYRRRGVAGQLLAHAEADAQRRGLPYVALMVTQRNAAARRLYERFGYETERRLLCKRLPG